MLGDEGLETMLRAADPVRDERLPPEGPAGLRVLTTARRRAGRSRLRRLVVIPTAVAVTVGAATAAVVLATGKGAVTDSTLVRCVAPEGGYRPIADSDPLPYMSTDFNAATDDLDAICRDLLTEVETGESVVADTQLTPCVNGEGLIVVRPGPTAVCAEHDEVRYVGVTEEQRRLAEFRLAVEDSVVFGEDDCFPMTDLPALVDRLQAEHGLTGWTVHLSDEVPGTCVSNVLFRESEREITAWALDERRPEEMLSEERQVAEVEFAR